MISPAALREFLARDLESFKWLKHQSSAQLDALLASIAPGFCPNPKLRRSQKVGLVAGILQPNMFFMYEMGTGKTLLMLELVRYWKGVLGMPALVLVPTVEIAFTWEAQIQEWGCGLTSIRLDQQSSHARWLYLEENRDADIVFITYPGAVYLVSNRDEGGKGKQKLRPRPQQVANFGKRFGILICDESTKIAHASSLQFRVTRGLAKKIPVRFTGAGRPFGRDVAALWGQFYITDGGETLGKHVGLFRDAFFTKTKNKFGGAYSFNYTFDAAKKKLLTRTLAHRSLTYTLEECVSLRQPRRIVKEVAFPGEAEAYYRRVVRELVEARGDYKAVQNAFLRMRQISSGFLTGKAGEEKIEVQFYTNPKLNLLLELVKELPENRKCVILHEFNISGARISAELRALGVGHERLWGGTKDSKRVLDTFKDSARCRVLVLNHRKGAFGIDGLQRVANYLFVYESPVAAIDRAQSERRISRPGQTQRAVIIDLVVRGSADSKILEYHAEGEGLLNALIRDPSVL